MCVNKALIIALCCMVSILGAGCESSSQAPKLDTSVVDKDSPRIIQYFPIDNEQLLESDQEFGILFSEEMDIDSLRDSIHMYEVLESELGEQNRREVTVNMEFRTLLMEDSDELTGLPKSKNATRVSLTLQDRNLPLGQTLFMEVEDTAKDVSTFETNHPLTGDLEPGNFMERSSNANYEILGGDWKEPALQTGFSEDIYALRALSNRQQRIVAYWITDNSGSSADQIQMSLYQQNDKRWTSLSGAVAPAFSSVPVPANATGAIFHMDAAMDQEGRIALVWEQTDSDTGSSAIYFNYFDGVDWLPVSSRVNDAGSFDASEVRIAELPDVGFFLAWVQQSAGDDRIDFRLLNTLADTPVLGSLMSEVALSASTIDSFELTAAPESVLLTQISASSSALYLSASFYRSIGEWLHIGRVSPEYYASGHLSGDVSTQDVAINSEGSGYIVWSQLNGGRKDIYRARIDDETVDSISLAEFNNVGDAYLPAVSMSDSGKASLLWLLDETVSLSVRVAMLDDPVEGWTERAESLGAHTGAQAVLSGAYDPYDNFYVIWTTGGTSNFVSSRRYDNELKEWESSVFIGESVSKSRDAVIRPLANDGRMLLLQSVLNEGVYGYGSTLYDQVD